MRRLTVALLAAAFAASCTYPATGTGVPAPSNSVPTPSSPGGVSFDAANVTEVVRFLAGEVGPREATTAAFRHAASFVEGRFHSFGYRVTRQPFHVLGGLSNFAAVQEGDTFNVIATPRGFDVNKPHLVVGAHLDTVPQAPGAVDNAAGVGIVIELARLAALSPPRVPVVFIAFGAEEARVPTGGLHGSLTYVASLSAVQRHALIGAIAIDRLGTGSRVPICTASEAGRALAQRLVAAARRTGVPFFECTNATSDHVSFDRAGIPAARIGPDSYPQYHTPQDVPSVFVPAQAGRAGTVLWEALRTDKSA